MAKTYRSYEDLNRIRILLSSNLQAKLPIVERNNKMDNNDKYQLMKNLRDPSLVDLLKGVRRRKMVPKKMMTWGMINKKKPLSNKV